jgi:ribonuclease HII
VIKIGVDEVGRGCLFGPVVSAAVVLKDDVTQLGLTDSKKLSSKKRDLIYESLYKDNHIISIGMASPKEIDEINILQASLLSMKRAVLGLKLDTDLGKETPLFVDGLFKIPDMDPSVPQYPLVKGELKEACIAAASIVAKVYRDRLINTMDKDYPGYGIKNHKGYPTKEHKLALSKLGPSPQHRTSFKGVSI